MKSWGTHTRSHNSSWEQVPVRRWPTIGAGLLVIAYFICSTRHVFQAWLLWDDIFNLHYYWSHPVSELVKGNLLFFSDYYRPLGGIFSLGLYRLFGLNATAYHVATLAILLFNLLILYGMTHVLSGSREIAFSLRFWAHTISTCAICITRGVWCTTLSLLSVCFLLF
jgi:hypothetical protein